MKVLCKKNIVLIVSAIFCLLALGGCNKEPVFVDADTQEIVAEIEVLETVVPDAVEQIMVHVCGAVVYPGVYELDAGSRVVDAVSQAGGLLPQAAADYVNLAAFVSDEDKIWIPTVEESEELLADGHEVSYITTFKADAGLETGTSSNSLAKININTADKELLCTLPGIGSTRADSIISYREQNGRFHSIEDIMKVSGIKDSSFQKIKEYIIAN